MDKDQLIQTLAREYADIKDVPMDFMEEPMDFLRWILKSHTLISDKQIYKLKRIEKAKDTMISAFDTIKHMFNQK